MAEAEQRVGEVEESEEALRGEARRRGERRRRKSRRAESERGENMTQLAACTVAPRRLEMGEAAAEKRTTKK